MRFFLIVLICFLGISGWLKGQTVAGYFEPPHPKEMLEDFQVVGHPDGGFGVCFTDAERIVVQTMDGTGGSIYQKTHQGDNTGISPLGCWVGKGGYLFAYNDDYSMDMVVVTAPFDQALPLKVDTFQVEGKQDIFFGNIVSHGELYCVVWNKSRHQLRLSRYDESKPGFETKLLPIADDLAKRMKQELFTPISDATVMGYELAMKPRKLYLLDKNRLAMTMEGENLDSCQTEMVLLDWAAGKLEKVNLGKPVVSKKSKHSTNSFVQDGFIALYKITEERMVLSVYDLQARKLVKEYAYSVDSPIRIIGSAMRKNEESYAVYNEDKLFSRKQTAEVMEDLSKGKPFLFFEPDGNGDIVFTIGNFEITSGKGGHMSGGFFIPNNEGPVLRYFHAFMKSSSFELNNEEGIQHKFLSTEVNQFLEAWKKDESGLLKRTPSFYATLVPGTKDAYIVGYIRDKEKVGLVRFSR